MDHWITRLVLGFLAALGGAASAPAAAQQGDPIVIRLSEELKERRAPIAEIISAKPGWVVGEDAAYEIAPNPEFSDDLFLVPIKGRTPETREAFDDRLKVDGPMSLEDIMAYYTNTTQIEGAWASNVPQPIDLGPIDAPTFLQELDRILHQLLRRHLLLKLESTRDYRESSTCIANTPTADDFCPMPGPDGWNTVKAGGQVFLNVKSEYGGATRYLTVLAVAPDLSVRVLLSQAARQRYSDGPLSAESSSVRYADNHDQPAVFERPGRYEIITITSDAPLDPALWAAPMGGQLPMSSCEDGLEEMLCYAMLALGPPSGSGLGYSVTVQTVHATVPITPTAYIVGGQAARLAVSRWQAQLFLARRGPPLGRSGNSGPGLVWRQNFEKSHRCGGSYLGDGFVLTSAHCIPEDTTSDLFVRLGTRDIASGGRSFAIDSIAIHPRGRIARGRADIALVRLKPDEHLSELLAANTLAPVAVATGGAARLNVGSPVVVTGWGFTRAVGVDADFGVDDFGRTQRVPRVLKEAELAAAAIGKCDRSEYRFYTLSESLCVESPVAGRDACYKDSGGPLTRVYRGRRYLVGIVTAGIGCAQEGEPSLYMRTSSFSGWIKRAMSELKRSGTRVRTVP